MYLLSEVVVDAGRSDEPIGYPCLAVYRQCRRLDLSIFHHQFFRFRCFTIFAWSRAKRSRSQDLHEDQQAGCALFDSVDHSCRWLSFLPLPLAGFSQGSQLVDQPRHRGSTGLVDLYRDVSCFSVCLTNLIPQTDYLQNLAALQCWTQSPGTQRLRLLTR